LDFVEGKSPPTSVILPCKAIKNKLLTIKKNKKNKKIKLIVVLW